MKNHDILHVFPHFHDQLICDSGWSKKIIDNRLLIISLSYGKKIFNLIKHEKLKYA